ncbi:helix-turn-helix domain-containing protein [Enterococcus sp. LJL120]
MEEARNQIKVIYSEITGNELLNCYQSIIKNRNISKGIQKTVKVIGRPSKISDKQIEKAYKLWKAKQMTQKQISNKLEISERTLRRYFSERSH